MSTNKLVSKTIPHLLRVIQNNKEIYTAIKHYNGDDFLQKCYNIHPSDSLIKLQTVNNFDINLCILNPNTFYYNKVPSYIRVLTGATYIELDINQKINPGFMISNNMSLQLCNPHTLSNNNMGTTILLTVNNTVNSNELPLL